jgi:hypothetical protein
MDTEYDSLVSSLRQECHSLLHVVDTMTSRCKEKEKEVMRARGMRKYIQFTNPIDRDEDQFIDAEVAISLAEKYSVRHNDSTPFLLFPSSFTQH